MGEGVFKATFGEFDDFLLVLKTRELGFKFLYIIKGCP